MKKLIAVKVLPDYTVEATYVVLQIDIVPMSYFDAVSGQLVTTTLQAGSRPTELTERVTNQFEILDVLTEAKREGLLVGC